MKAALKELSSFLPGDALLTDAESLSRYGRDWTRVYTPAPCAVVLPRTTDEVSRILRVCSSHGLAVVPSGGRTGLSAGAVAIQGELVLSLERMNHIGVVNPAARTVRVQAGAITQAVHQHCEPSGLTWPIDFASKGSSQVGGNIATNAGGVRVIRYGLTRNWVLALQVVLASGEVLELNGDLEKNNTGYDLRQLLIGSEGTLGIITEATLKLTSVPGESDVGFFALRDLDSVLKLYRAARESGLTLGAFEFLTLPCLQAVLTHRGLRSPFSSDETLKFASHFVLIEIERPHGEAGLAGLQSWYEKALSMDGVLDATLAQSPKEVRELWELREGVSESLAARSIPHKNDLSLPLRALEPFCRELEERLGKTYPEWEVYLFGHIGDGNLHLNVLKPQNLSLPEFLARTGEVDREIFELIRKHAGSVSAEHGIGLLKKKALPYTRSAAELEIFRGIKKVLDPQGILNPGKIIDLN